MKIDQIIRTKRRTYALIVKRDGSLVVRAPKHATQEQIQTLVSQKERWIISKQELVKSIYPAVSPKEFVDGEGFLYLGKSYPLAIVEDQDEPLKLTDRFYLDRSALVNASAIFRNWYQAQAYELISKRVAWYAAKHGFAYQQVKIMDARTRWGSCGSKGRLNFAWRLVMAPLRVIDYVVIHELVHLHEKNHSKSFWGKVKTIMPDCSQQVAWLKRFGHTLTL
jgi:hypothetical protein